MAKHGTHGGYKAHKKINEPVCDLCAAFKKEYQSRYYKSNKQKCIDYARNYYYENKEIRDIQRRAWARANPERTREYNRNLYRKNPQATLERTRRRKVRILGNEIKPYTLQEVLEEYGSVCYLCEIQIDLTLPRKIGVSGWEYGLHLDHVIPVSKNGGDTLENVAPTHAICNLNKRDN